MICDFEYSDEETNMRFSRAILAILLCCLTAFSFSGCFLNPKMYPLSDEELADFKKRIEDYASEHNYKVKYDDLIEIETNSYAQDKKYYESDLRENALCGDICIKNNSVSIEFMLNKNRDFEFSINGFNENELYPFAYEFIEFTNSFSKYEIKKSDLEDFFNTDSYKKGEFMKSQEVDFWGNAILNYHKSITEEDGEYIPPVLGIGNVLKVN